MVIWHDQVVTVVCPSRGSFEVVGGTVPQALNPSPWPVCLLLLRQPAHKQGCLRGTTGMRRLLCESELLGPTQRFRSTGEAWYMPLLPRGDRSDDIANDHPVTAINRRNSVAKDLWLETWNEAT